MADDQATQQEAPKDEQTAQGESISKKKEKINKLSLNEINHKIEEMEKANQTQSRYYQHLLNRRNEIQSL